MQDDLRRRSLRMARLVEDMLEEALETVFHPNEALARRVISRDAEVDAEEVEVESEVIRLLALFQPMGSDLRLLCTILKVNSDLERVADCAVNIAERAAHLDIRSVDGESKEVIRHMAPLVQQLLHRAIQAYSSDDAEEARAVISGDEPIDALYGQAIRRIVLEAAGAADRMAAYLDLLSVAKNLERIADHAGNIAEDVVFLSTGRIVRHQKG